MRNPLRRTLLFTTLVLLLGGAVAGIPGPAVADVETHNALLKKPAPDLKADFAVNGKPVSLADLKGKVVLLVFWRLGSGPSETVMPRIDDWERKTDFALNGFTAVAVNGYNADSKFKLKKVFNKETEKIEDVTTLTHEQEQKALADYAAAHNLSYRMMKLPAAEAARADKEYGVRPVPQFVLIDRKGVVRKIVVGSDDKKLDDLENAIRKLIETGK
jgi:cytochrome oxidase Cu insertion factor (SCO1/SenC/PrrC family)